MPQGYIIKPFPSIELACAVRQPGPCLRALCQLVVLLSKNMTCAQPRCNATPSKKKHTSRAHRTSHFTLALHTLHFFASELFLPHLICFCFMSFRPLPSKKILFIFFDKVLPPIVPSLLQVCCLLFQSMNNLVMSSTANASRSLLPVQCMPTGLQKHLVLPWVQPVAASRPHCRAHWREDAQTQAALPWL